MSAKTAQMLSTEDLLKYYALIKKELQGRGVNPDVALENGRPYL